MLCYNKRKNARCFMVFMESVDSGVIREIGYDKHNKELFITFVNGSEYAYFGVSDYMYNRFLLAESKGTFFNKKIKNKYEYEKEE